ncbi:MAG: DNA-3-methyladenine glycosylase 2 family protein [Candidatus Andersenbacteria bacterium]
MARPRGPFDLANQNQFFGGWPTLADEPGALVLSFPVEGWDGSAAVVLRQTKTNGRVTGEVYGTTHAPAKAKAQALAALSLDQDGTGWPAIGKRDPVIGALQKKYRLLRPSLFNSPYEAAAHFIIAHRISMLQGRAIRARMAEEFGEAIRVGRETFYAFPTPQRLLQIKKIKSLPARKIDRLHGVAQAALEGTLDRAYLRKKASASSDQALEELQRIAGIGPFFASGILRRGAGLVDSITRDSMTRYAVQKAYRLPQPPNDAQLDAIADRWHPYRMWAIIVLHIWVRREVGRPGRLAPRRSASR